MADLNQDEMIEILECIARDGSDNARIQAIKTLLQIQGTNEEGVGDDELERLIQGK